MADNVSKEEGNHLYSLSFSTKEPGLAIIMERYTGKEALVAHSKSDYYKAFTENDATH